MLAYNLFMICLYFAAMIFVGIYFQRKASKSSDAFILAGRQAPLWIVIGSIFATWVSSATLIGYTGVGYSSGIAGYWSGGAFMVACTWLGFWAIPKLRASKITTIPELFERYFGLPHRMIAVVLVLARDLGVTAGVAYGMAVIFQYLFQVSTNVALLITVGVVIVYTITGGAWAVLVTDSIQAAIIIIGSTLLIPMAVFHIGGWSEFSAAIPATHTAVLNVGFKQTVGWILNGLFITFAYQTLLQRGLSAQDTKTAQKSFIYGGLLSLLWYMVPYVLGICAFVLFPGIKGEDAFIKLAMMFGPHIGVLFVIVLLAACMSTVSACILTVTSNITLDIYKRIIQQNIEEKALVKIQRISTVIITIIAVIIGKSLPYILELLWVGGRIMAAGLAPVFMAIIFWPAARRARISTLLAMILGASTTLIAQLVQKQAAANAAAQGSTAFIWTWDPVVLGLPVTFLILIVGVILEVHTKKTVSTNGMIQG
ncbi:sodium:solute symporter family protein [Candidatus Formimonas warabiya]|uniref:Sodium:solute symporter family protein n=1 Tax=Formimonas warabiya TaxID=1761012 RepID=A0A3G1KR74_FORW1|nr:sodium:solute symporter family protein [Candidatus Formimonas warabiya]ATW24969.1 hypothetical protein DCMF_09460 [Candidatus Formimonas warabiya]